MKKVLMIVVAIGAMGLMFGACKKPAPADEGEEAGETEEGDEEEGDEAEAEEEGGGGGGGGVCGDYEKCCTAYMEALSKVDNMPQASIDAAKTGCDAIKDIKGTPGADEGCKAGLDGLKQGAEAMKAMPGFEMPDACK